MYFQNDRHIVIFREVYAENGYPSDRLFRDDRAAKGLLDEFNRRARASYALPVMKAGMEWLRKNKQSTGGLPRLGRSFSGPKFVSDN